MLSPAHPHLVGITKPTEITMTQVTTQDTPTYLTPEDLFFITPDAQGVQLDAVCCALDRALAIVLLLLDHEGNSFTAEQLHLLNALWAVEGLLKQAKAIATQVEGVRISE
jgi:alanine dehydrogenase